MCLLGSFPDTRFSFNINIKNSQLNNDKYKYSDLPYYILKEFIENYYSSDLSSIIGSQMFNKMGIETCFKTSPRYPNCRKNLTKINYIDIKIFLLIRDNLVSILKSVKGKLVAIQGRKTIGSFF